jgi:hypothetical protein
MEKKNKKTLLITSAILLIGGGIGYWLWKRKKDFKSEETPMAQQPSAETPNAIENAIKTNAEVKSTGTKAIVTKPTVAPLFVKGDSVIVRTPKVSADAWGIKLDGKGSVMPTTKIGTMTKATVLGIVVKNPSQMILEGMVTPAFGVPFQSKVFVSTKDWMKG